MMPNIINGYKLNLTNKIKRDAKKDIDIIFESGNLASGNFVKRFEKTFEKLNKSKFSIACSSGGSALEIIFQSLNLKGKEILVPTNTFIATYNAIKFSGAIPKFIDTEKNSLLISLNQIKKKISKKTKCICIVHIGAYIPNDIDKIVEFCKKKKIYLIEDCAHAVLTSYKGKYAGNFGDAGAFSFYSTKSVTSGEGGMITTNNFKLYKKMKSITSYGMTKSYGIFDYKYFSSNYRMNEMEAVIGYHHLINYKFYLDKKKKIKNIYDKYLKDYVKIFKTKSKGNLYKYICLLKSSDEKKKLVKYLNNKHIFLSGDVYTKPLHEYKLIKKKVRVKLPNSSDVCSRHICLPIYNGLKNEEIKKVYTALIAFFKKID
ncbi:DegT/DnrJ/EryC1/StrS aminotransferase family protein [Candidatus Pelagibacter sp.]|nr:DegT/DnrJ/EryC1/StrS aminotransferase family protein [Candidatus Pelagibacter sp.]